MFKMKGPSLYRNSPLKEKAKGVDGKACWKGYSLRGTKMKNGKRVDNCVKIDSPAKHCGCGTPVKMRKTTKGEGRTFRTPEEGAGMTNTGVKQYRAENPGSKLKTAVTGKVKPGSKAAKRRKSFCARSKGWTGERGRAARRRWKC